MTIISSKDTVTFRSFFFITTVIRFFIPEGKKSFDVHKIVTEVVKIMIDGVLLYTLHLFLVNSQERLKRKKKQKSHLDVKKVINIR